MNSEATGVRPSIIVLGDVMSDIVVRLAAQIAVGSDTPAAISMHGGGSGANQATWLATSAPNLDVHFIGSVGDDPLGDAHKAAFAGVGISTHLAVDPQRPTGAVVSLVDTAGQRSMLTERGANAGLSIRDLPETLFQPHHWLHISGYTLLAEETRGVALEAIQRARAAGMRFSVDPASEAMLLSASPENFLTWTKGADLCFPNIDEGCLLSGEVDPVSAAQVLCEDYGSVALKLGAEGALWACRDQATVRQPCVPTTVVDTTGAGDAFCAGFLASWLSHGSPEKALDSATQLAAVAVAQAGARPKAGDLRLKA